MRPSSPWRGAAVTLGLFAFYLATFDSETGSPDETQRYALSLELVKSGLWDGLKNSGYLSKYPPLQSLAAAPLMALGMRLDGGQDGLWTHRLGLSLSLFACATMVPLFYWIARTLELSPRRSAGVTLLFGLTNPVWPYSKRFFSEPLTAFLALGAFAGAFAFTRSTRRSGWLSLAFALCCVLLLPLNNMVVPVGVVIGVALLLLHERRYAALGLHLLTSGAAAALTAWCLKFRFRSLTGGYSEEKFTFGYLEGWHGLLFGFGRSIFLYAPLVILALLGARAFFRKARGLALGTTVCGVVVLHIIACWWCWWGGICWGPRLVLPVLPLLSLGVIPLLAEPRPWKRWAALVFALTGLYVQALGFSFKHDFDIFFWMREYYVDEKKSWFGWEYSQLHRMPRHFVEHPWDLSFAWLTLEQRGPSTVEVGSRPAQRIELTERGDEIVYHWSITDLYAVLADGRRVPAGQLGATLATFNGADGAGALDGNPETRWSSGSKRLDGMSVTLQLPQLRSDLVRLELEHLPSEHDFPNGLTARVEAAGVWTEVPAHAATPRLHFRATFYLLLGGGLVLLVASAGGRDRAPLPVSLPAEAPPLEEPLRESEPS